MSCGFLSHGLAAAAHVATRQPPQVPRAHATARARGGSRQELRLKAARLTTFLRNPPAPASASGSRFRCLWPASALKRSLDSAETSPHDGIQILNMKSALTRNPAQIRLRGGLSPPRSAAHAALSLPRSAAQLLCGPPRARDVARRGCKVTAAAGAERRGGLWLSLTS